jgi:hypothetical protein
MSSYDSDIGIERVLRPQWRFEELYCPNGLSDQVSGAVPILFTYPPNPNIPAYGIPDMSILDPEAAKNPPPPGISPILAKFMPCSIGSTILCMFPIVPRFSDNLLYTQKWAYVWRVVFRLRNAGDYIRRKQHRAPFAVGKANFGASDTRNFALVDRPTLAPFSGQRLVLPACTESQVFAGNPNVDTNIQSDLVVNVDSGNQERAPVFGYLYSDAVAIPADNFTTSYTALYPAQSANLSTPRIPMDYQQGVFDPGMPAFSGTGTGFVPTGPTHLPKFIKCLGNEMAVECFKYELLDTGDVNLHAPKAWYFTFDGNHQCNGGADYGFSVMFGLGATSQSLPPPVDTGVRILQGSWPL